MGSEAQMLANQAANAIQNARLYNQAQLEIAERVRTEQALRESEERYRLAQRIGRVGNWEYDLRHETLWGSEEALRIFGLDEERGELTREQIQGCLVEEEPITQAILDLVDHGAPFDHEFEITPLEPHRQELCGAGDAGKRVLDLVRQHLGHANGGFRC